MTIQEDHGHAPTVDHGKIDVTQKDVRARINAGLANALSGGCITPYVGLEKIRKVLSYYSIFIPGVNFLEGESGEHQFEVSQFGSKLGAHENGQIITKDEIQYEINFTWDGCGGTCFCQARIREVGENVNESLLHIVRKLRQSK